MDTNYKMISSLLLAGVSTCGIARQPMQNPMEPVKERPNIPGQTFDGGKSL